jgi:hypothetical protein
MTGIVMPAVHLYNLWFETWKILSTWFFMHIVCNLTEGDTKIMSVWTSHLKNWSLVVPLCI